MILRWTIAALVALSLAACGVKSPLDTPTPMQTDNNKKRPDPSLPPQPLGQ
jgi:predicted small lipoprotein YifL